MSVPSVKDTLQYQDRPALDRLNDHEGNNALLDASYLLQSNTGYPLSLLDDSRMDCTVDADYRRQVLESVDTYIKYKGYIEREERQAEKLSRLEYIRIPASFDYSAISSLSIESRQKLNKYRPETIAQASRIPGVSPADISVLFVYFGR